MIDLREIRVGNWIKSIHTGATQVSLFMLGEIADDETYLDHLMPIPLTPELLVKAGFTWETDQKRHLQLEISHGKRLTFYYNGDAAEMLQFYQDDYLEGFFSIESPKYVHQFQNLYFSITGQELEINL